MVEFAEADAIALKGEEASWVGILLSGQCEARDDGGVTLAVLNTGEIVGEMALFTSCG